VRLRCREDVDRALTQRDNGALGVLALAHAKAGTTGLALAVHGVDLVDLHAEDLLDGELDLRLVRAWRDLEGVLAVHVDKCIALLRHNRAQDNIVRILVQAHYFESSCAVRAATNPSKAALVKTRSSLTTTSYALSWLYSMTCT